jgi:hypothetical protein
VCDTQIAAINLFHAETRRASLAHLSSPARPDTRSPAGFVALQHSKQQALRKRQSKT